MADRLDQVPAPAADDLRQFAQQSAVSHSVVVVVVNIWIVRVSMFENFVHMRVRVRAVHVRFDFVIVLVMFIMDVRMCMRRVVVEMPVLMALR